MNALTIIMRESASLREMFSHEQETEKKINGLLIELSTPLLGDGGLSGLADDNMLSILESRRIVNHREIHYSDDEITETSSERLDTERNNELKRELTKSKLIKRPLSRRKSRERKSNEAELSETELSEKEFKENPLAVWNRGFITTEVNSFMEGLV